MNIRKKVTCSAILILFVLIGIVCAQRSIIRVKEYSTENIQTLTEAEQVEIGKNAKITSATVTRNENRNWALG